MDWFNLIQKTILQYGIDPDDIYNFDETGFAMGLTATTKVVTLEELRSVVNDGLFTSKGEEEENWGVARRILMTAFGINFSSLMFHFPLD
ncbi:hypothetical protein SI65_00498 [Aspergillus cristatus]|uniref:DDE-1 domain-containing protein n=1 Tax=Aspergillus cristatus TaxID=573508 RepID=A0A1E3BPN6_ASPCR|nr:hypothetical protein SI65_00498 [Aspergillus cristatus]